ncbi:hypothetical protein [Salinicola acroporae]|uniref:hypothetical protein n=1 Tax=Salinicola acroporae TaxID=1541440 RepID=UPI00197D8807|nr:hypothetical protein [Salinicola acroporae]
MENIIAFIFAATLLTLTPGLDTALVLRTASIEGPWQAVKAALGINVGCFLWGRRLPLAWALSLPFQNSLTAC